MDHVEKVKVKKNGIEPPKGLALESTGPTQVKLDPKEYAPRVTSIPITIEQISPLIVNNFNEKLRYQMLQGHMGAKKEKRAPKDPEALFQGSKYLDELGRDSMPIGGIRNAMIAAARGLDGITMTALKQSIFIESPDGPDKTLVPLTFERCEMRSDAVRNDSGVADIRIRACYYGWGASFTLHVLENVVSVVQAFQLLSHAGFCVGLCEWRPAGKKGTGGTFGRFKIAEMK